MSAHNHREIVPGCFRCDLGQAEVAAQAWQDALVVRDRLGQLRHAGGFLDEPIGLGLDPLEAAVFADTFGPLVPILGRTGLPVVTTVGDLTARHRGKRVRVKASISDIRPASSGQWIIGTLDEIFVGVGELGLTLDAARIEGADHGDYLWCPYFAYGTDELDTPVEVLG